MTDQEVTFAEILRVAGYLPKGWAVHIALYNYDDIDVMLSDPYSLDIVNFSCEGDTNEIILGHVNEARRMEGLKPVNWNGEEVDGIGN